MRFLKEIKLYILAKIRPVAVPVIYRTGNSFRCDQALYTATINRTTELMPKLKLKIHPVDTIVDGLTPFFSVNILLGPSTRVPNSVMIG